jgi:DNA-binding NtrC family response regulator
MHHIAKSQSYVAVVDRPLRVILTDHNPYLRGLLATALRMDGHLVEELTDGGQLLEHFATLIVEDREHEVDLIISEQDLPGIPGLLVLAGLRARGRLVPFVLMTGDGPVQKCAAELGAAVLDRPLSVDAIREALRQAASAVAAPRTEVPTPANDVHTRVGHS